MKELKQVNIILPPNPTDEPMSLKGFQFPPNADIVHPLEEQKVYTLDSKNGNRYLKEVSFAGYDESIYKYLTLEGEAYLTSHSLVLIKNDNFIPVNLLTFYFYTRSKVLTEKLSNIKYTDNPNREFQRDYIKDKIDFLINYASSNSILFIDGPLIGGDLYTYMIHAIDKFIGNNIIPIFFVKNSDSNLVTDYLTDLTGRYNSDMHWSHTLLKNGQRTRFYKYMDQNNPQNAKIFCYLKPFKLCPQRIEFHVDTYDRYKDNISNILDLVYYLLLVQGDLKNPQIRPIAIAEKYARATLKAVNINRLLHVSGLTPTINQTRFGE
ncbi:DNA double-strand break repair nuclease NurA [Candidatus Dependentiae bacterium]|nr:DNA double-strand break repair nuclease NurA [Candidatus Dependentiae bacterium]